jgi:hypothetical protein
VGYSNNDCYLSIFDTGKDEDNWYLGTQALQEIVVIFYQESESLGSNTKIGIGKSIEKTK